MEESSAWLGFRPADLEVVDVARERAGRGRELAELRVGEVCDENRQVIAAREDDLPRGGKFCLMLPMLPLICPIMKKNPPPTSPAAVVRKLRPSSSARKVQNSCCSSTLPSAGASSSRGSVDARGAMTRGMGSVF